MNTILLKQQLSQDVFLKVWVHRDQLPAIGDLRAWIFTITANAARSWLRKKMLDRSLLQNYAPLTISNNTDHLLSFNETNRLIHEAIQMLPPQRRQIYSMQRVEGKKLSEIARELDISLSNVKNTLASALEQIRKYLEQYTPLTIVILSFLWQ